MCIHIGCDVVLANLLMYSPNFDDGIDFSDIEKYCGIVQENLLESRLVKVESVSFQVNDDELESNLRAYPAFFKRFSGRYYRGTPLNSADEFNELFSTPIREILVSAARKI